MNKLKRKVVFIISETFRAKLARLALIATRALRFKLSFYSKSIMIGAVRKPRVLIAV